ncbi:MAG TPA: penicillin-binding protein 2 [Streptosporangiaceae bacterium]|jgi:cell division protein FtsI (penicillin-binding protein 3)
MPRRVARIRAVLRRASPARRLGATLLVLAVVLSVFAGRLVQLQGLDAGQFRAAANSQRLGQVAIPAVRGEITSSDGSVLAMTESTDTVFADPELIPAGQRGPVAAALAAPLHMAALTIEGLLDNPPFGPAYVVLAKNVPATTGQQITNLKLPGVDMTPTYTRSYPSGDLASDIVGFTNTSGRGALTGEAGLEYEYNSLLAGRPGSEEIEEGVDGQPIPLTEQKLTPAVPAKSIRLTINSSIQYEADQVCQQRVQVDHARNCSIVVMQPQTGAILAMAQWPTYNPVNPGTASTTNIAVANVFAPGSTLKPVTVAAALEHGGQTPLSTYTVPDRITIDDKYTGYNSYSFQDAELHATEHYTIAGILANSSNVGMVQVVQHITPQEQYDYLRAFGLGSSSGLSMPGETSGLLPEPGSSAYPHDTPLEYSFGQGLGVTAIQMASIYSAIANGGVRVPPTLVAGTVSNGAYTPARPGASRRVIKAKTARQLLTMLQQVPMVDASAGEDWGLIPGYTVAAKTGTAQVSAGGSKCLCQYGSSYIGIAPADNPQLVVAVNIQDPRGRYFGDEVAGPAFFDVMKFALQTMKIPPDYAKPPYIRLSKP